VQLSSAIRYLGYPANLASIVFIAFASILLTAGLRTIPFGGLLVLIMLTWFLKYGLVLVEHIAWQTEGEPVLSVEMINPIEQKKSFVLLIVVGELSLAGWAATYWLGAVAGWIIGLLAIALLPAVVAIQTGTDSALKGLDPRLWYRVIRWMKLDYVQLIVCIFVFWVLAILILFSPFGAALPLVVKIALLMFGWLSVLSMLGGSVLERRLADPDDTPLERAAIEVSPEEIEKERARKIDSIYGEWRSGAQKNAWQTLMRTVESSEDPLNELRWLHERIAAWREPRLAGRVAQELVPRLLAVSRFGEAIAITRQRIAEDPEYRPVTANETLRMVRVARDGGDRPTARALLRDFQRFFPNDPLQPAADDLAQQLQR
jgi:hypothetical protein